MDRVAKPLATILNRPVLGVINLVAAGDYEKEWIEPNPKDKYLKNG